MAENKKVMKENVTSNEPPGGRWMIVVVGMIIQLCLGAIYAYGAVRIYLLEYFKSLGLTPTALDMTWPFILFLGVFAITMPLAGPYIQKYGPKKICMIGGALCGLGWFAASYASSPFMLIPLYAIIGGLGVGIAYGVAITTSAQWFPDKRGLAVGLTVLGFGLSSAFITYSTKYMVVTMKMPIMDVLKIFGVAFFIITILLSLYLRFPQAGWKPAGWTPPAPSAGVAPKVDFMRNEMVKTKTFYGLWLCYTIGALAGLTAIGIAGPVGQEVMKNSGMAAAEITGMVFALVLPFAIFNGFGRPVFGALTDKLNPRNTAIISYVLILVSCLLMYTFYSSVWVYIICFSILWGCLGGWLAIAPTATASYFGMKDNAKNYGLVFTAYGAGAVIGGIVSAMAKDILGDYKPFFLIVAVLAILGLILAFLLMKPPIKKTE